MLDPLTRQEAAPSMAVQSGTAKQLVIRKRQDDDPTVTSSVERQALSPALGSLPLVPEESPWNLCTLKGNLPVRRRGAPFLTASGTGVPQSYRGSGNSSITRYSHY